MDEATNSELWRTICPVLYQETDPARLPEEAQRVLEWQYGPRGLIVYGPTGTCKTRAVWLLIRRLLAEGIHVTTFDCTRFGNRLADRFREGDATYWLDYWAKATLIFFDDIDKTRFTDRVESEFFTLIERRCANRLPTIITTNVVGGTIERALPRVGRPLVRRLREDEFFEQVNFGKESKR